MVVRTRQPTVVKHREDGTPVVRERLEPAIMHCDIIKDEFWTTHSNILN